MAFEVIQRGQQGQRRLRDWLDKPCVAIGKSGLSFNIPAQSAFGLKAGAYVLVMVQREPFPSIAFKISSNGEQATTRIETRTKNEKASRIKCPEIQKRLPFAIGKAYRLGLNAQERVIEAQITTTNEAKT